MEEHSEGGFVRRGMVSKELMRSFIEGKMQICTRGFACRAGLIIENYSKQAKGLKKGLGDS